MNSFILITSPLNNADFLAKPEVDDWYKGIPITFTANDPDGNITEYAWRVDGGEWNWTTDTSVIIPPTAWSEPLEEEHIITVISRDDTYLIDPVGDSIEIEIYVPTFEKDILILDGTVEDASLPDFDGLITDEMTDSAYYEIFGGMIFMDLCKNHLSLYNNSNVLNLTNYNLLKNQRKKRVIISNIFKGSSISKLENLMPGDLIKKINNKEINTLQDFRKIINNLYLLK